MNYYLKSHMQYLNLFLFEINLKLISNQIDFNFFFENSSFLFSSSNTDNTLDIPDKNFGACWRTSELIQLNPVTMVFNRFNNPIIVRK